MLYVGVDAHKRTSHVTIMDEQGSVVRRKNIPTTREAVQGILADLPGSKKAVVEASYSWGLIYDWLDEVTDEVVLAHPLKVRVIAEARIKTDAIDSETLAHLLRADLIPAAYAPPATIRAVKRILRQRLFMVRVRTMVKNRISALIDQHGLTWPKVSDRYGRAGMIWLKQQSLPAPDDKLLQSSLEMLTFVTKSIKETESLIRDLAKDDDAVRWLQSIPGIGPFFSVLIRYEVNDITRFRSAAKFAGYTGLVPSTYASGDRMVHGRITKQGNRNLRWALIEAVMPAVQHSPFLARSYYRIKARRVSKDAAVATARKLAELIWTVWTEKRCYEER